MMDVVMGATLLTLPLYEPKPASGDWLLNEVPSQAKVYRTPTGLALSNGLCTREFFLGETAATISIHNLSSSAEMLRATGPEAVFVIDGKTVEVGGLHGQPNRAYLDRAWLPKMKPAEGALRFVGYEVGDTVARLAWTPLNRKTIWPPDGVGLTLRFEGQDLQAEVHYELYDGIPLMSKWVELTNRTGRAIRLDRFELERLSIVEGDSNVDSSVEWRRPEMTVLTDYNFAGMSISSSNKAIVWETEPEFTTQVNYELQTPCQLRVRPPYGPAVDLQDGQTFTTFRTFMLLHEGNDRERQGLGIRRIYRTVAPWVLDNPLMLHLTSTDPQVVRTAIDQAAECGFEMVVISFWSGLDMEDLSPTNIAKFRGFADYAQSKGLRLGGYSLLASRSIDKQNDVVNPKPIFGNSPCLGSEWGQSYFDKLRSFLTETAFDLLEHDGSYPGDTCASTDHPGHRDFDDSQWTQYQTIAEFYRWCRERGIYLNVPDSYHLAGSNKTGMGYRETNWSLPREQQHIHARQNLYDGTWEKTPSMGWMMVPLVEYQGGGPAATIEPLKEHLEDYGMHLANNLGYGAQACYRGPRLYDSPETKAVVQKWVGWFKNHREILESDVIHVRRADGKRLDAVLHVNPSLQTKAMAVIYNPTDRPLTEEIRLPLYYSGLKGSCRVSWNDGPSRSQKLDDQRRLVVKPTVPARSCVWVTFH